MASKVSWTMSSQSAFGRPAAARPRGSSSTRRSDAAERATACSRKRSPAAGGLAPKLAIIEKVMKPRLLFMTGRVGSIFIGVVVLVMALVLILPLVSVFVEALRKGRVGPAAL